MHPYVNFYLTTGVESYPKRKYKHLCCSVLKNLTRSKVIQNEKVVENFSREKLSVLVRINTFATSNGKLKTIR